MKLIKPSVESLWLTEDALCIIEEAGRTCYKSEDNITRDSAPIFVQKILDRGHHAMIEHASASYRVICDRGVTHEIVRHRLFSYAQESTRYCNYKGGVTFIIPCWFEGKEDPSHWGDTAKCSWWDAMNVAEKSYLELLKKGWTPQQARSVLPNSLKTEIVVTGNLREWRHFFSLRCTPKNIPEDKKINGIYYGADAPHPQMQEVANMILEDIRKQVPVLFDEF